MDETKEVNYGKLVEWALLPEQQVHRFEHNGATYVRQEGIVNAIFSADKLTEEHYPYLISYLENGRSKHKLGNSFEFLPPIVPYAQKGVYYTVIETPSIEKIFQIVESIDFSQVGRRRSDKPEEQAWKDRVFNFTLAALYPKTHREKIDTAIKEFIAKQIAPAMTATGWTSPTDTLFTRPLKIDFAARANMKRYLVGDPLDPRQFNEYVSMDAYGYSYYLPDSYFTEEFQEHAKTMAIEFGYILDGGYYKPKPVPLPDDIEQLGQQILSNKENILNKKTTGEAVILLDTIEEHLRAAGIPLKEQQVKDQLLGPQGEWRVPLVMNGFHLRATTVYASSFKADLEGYSYQAVAKERHPGAGETLDRKHAFASGYPVIINAITIDGNSGTLVYLDMAGSKNAIKANWAALMQTRYHAWMQIRFRVATADNHLPFEQSLPSGMHQMLLINKAASPKYIMPNTDIVYLINKPTGDMPEQFGATLDKMLSVSVLPAWYTYLWVIGRATGLIEYCGNPNKQIGITTWKIRNISERWNELISAAIAAKEITL